MSKITLTAEMIHSLAAFAVKDGQAAYTLAHGHIPAQAGFAGYSGLIAYSVSDDGGVLALEEVRQKDGAGSTNALSAATVGNQSVGYTREELAAHARYLAENNPVDMLSRKIVDVIKQEIPAEVLDINNFSEAMWVAMQMICGPQGAAMTISRCQIAD